MILIVPEKLDLVSHTRNYPPVNYGIKKFRSEVVEYLITLLIQIPANNEEIEKNMKGGFVPMNAQLLQRLCGRQYHLYLSYLVSTGIFETDNIYISGKKSPGNAKSRGYRLAEYFSAYSLKAKNINDKKLKKNLLTDFRLKIIIDPVYAHLVKWLGLESPLTIDYPAALHYIESKRDYLLAHPELRDEKHIIGFKNGKLEKQTIIKDPVTQYQYAFINVQTIYQHAIYSLVDPSVGRLHTPLTNIKSELRNFMKHNNETLVSIDLKNSQPYLCNIFLKREFWSSQVSENRQNSTQISVSSINRMSDNNNYYFSNITHKYNNNIINNKSLLELNNTNNKNTYNNINLSTSVIILVEICKVIEQEVFNTNFEQAESEFALYRQLTGDGEFYPFLQRVMSGKLGDAFKDKKAVKEMIFIVFFTANRYQPPQKKMFKELFPVLTKIFSIIKKRGKELLPRLLQSIEAYLFLKVITKEIAEKYPKIPLYTIHDSIVTTKEHVPVIRQVMHDILLMFVGVVPTLEEEEWNPELLKKYEENSVIAA